MAWNTPADAQWANNFTVTCLARIEDGKACVEYRAMHLPTMHVETSGNRAQALGRLKTWIAAQTPPRKDPEGAASPYGPDARRRAVQERLNAIQRG